MNALQAYVAWIDRWSDRIGRSVCWLSTLLVLVVCYDVFTRYILGNSLVWVVEMEWHLFSLLFLLGAAYTLRHDGHVRVDVFYSRFSRKGQAWIDLLGTLIWLLPFCLMIIVTSKDFVEFAYKLKETSPDPGGLPMRWLLKSAIPVAGLMLFLQGTSLAGRSLLTILGRPLEDAAEPEIKEVC